jgi:Kef-type K+ transport system membrane component KefB
MLKVLRNIAIIALLALAVAAVPGGGNVADALITALVMAFLAAIAFAVYRIFRQNSFAYLSLSDGWRAAVVVAVGAIVLMIAGTDELLATGFGLLIWLGVLGGAVFTLVRAWGEAQSY